MKKRRANTDRKKKMKEWNETRRLVSKAIDLCSAAPMADAPVKAGAVSIKANPYVDQGSEMPE